MKDLNSNDVILVIGASLTVRPVANIPFIGVHKQVPFIEIDLIDIIPDEIMCFNQMMIYLNQIYNFQRHTKQIQYFCKSSGRSCLKL